MVLSRATTGWVVARSLPDVRMVLSRATTGAVCWVLAGPITILVPFLEKACNIPGRQLCDVDILI
jgi:hypothetical protein